MWHAKEGGKQLFSDIRELKEQVEHIYGILNRIFALGKVVAIDEERGLVRVKLEEHDNLTTYWLPVLYTKTQFDKEYWLPDIDEMVLCVFTPPSFERGFVIGSFYTQEDKPPEATRDKWVKKFKDGTVIEYDRENSKLFLDIKKDAEVNINNQITLKSKSKVEETQTKTEAFNQGSLKMTSWQIEGNITLQGNLLVLGNISSTGTITAQSGLMTAPAGLKLMVDDFLTIYNSHTHTDSNNGTTSPPNQIY